MITLSVDVRIPESVRRLTNPTVETWNRAMRLAAVAAMRDCVRNFERQGYEDPPGVFHPWKELSPVTLGVAEQKALTRVGPKGKIRYRKTESGPLPIAVGVGEGEQRTARVRRSRGSMILIDTGRLRSSLIAGTEHVQRTLGTEVLVGTRVRYAAIHELGANITVTEGVRKAIAAIKGVYLKRGTILRIPARPFLRVSQSGLQDIARIVLHTFVRGAR